MSALRLHLGCGRKKWDGFVNIDLRDSDHDCDIRKLPYPDDSVLEVVAIHVVEHFFITEVAEVLKEWHRVLAPGGRLVIELPCWDKVQKHIVNNSPDNFTRWALFGDPRTHKDGVPALHKWCWYQDEMIQVLLLAGFKEVREQEPLFHQPSRDMRLVAIK